MSYQRKEFVYNLSIREIRFEDGEKSFRNEFQSENTQVLSQLTSMNVENRYVILFEYNGKILGFLTFLDLGDHLHIDLVETNRLYDISNIVKPGVQLIMFIEQLSRQQNFSIITLHSTQENIPLYSGLEYERDGEDFEDSNYGTLTPMKKTLS